VLRVAAVTAAALSAFLVSCFSKPGEPHAGRNDAITDGVMGSDSGSGSGSGSGSNQMCTNQPSDNFNSSTDCGTWGTRYGSAAPFGRNNGELEIESSAFSSAYCETNQAFSFANGTSVKISRIAETMASTYFKVRSAANGSDYMMVTIDSYSGPFNVTLACSGASGGSRPYDAVSDLWWKFELAATAVGAQVQASHSMDGANWTPEGNPCPWQTANQVYAELGTGGSTYGAAIVAHFDDFNMRTCPP
jgi:hypothetical protein